MSEFFDVRHDDANQAMQALVEHLMLGRKCAPRGKPIRELVGKRVAFDMRYPLVTRPTRGLGYRFAPAEAAWILSGDNRVDTIRQYSRFIWEFSDDGFFYSGAYGPKLVDQLTYAMDALADDPDTRQSVIEIWRPNPRPGRDLPCTLSFQFLIRDRKLHVVQTMRSSDAWLGYPYDVFNASMLAGYVMLLLRRRKDRRLDWLELGTHTMMIGSSHLYEKDVEKARAFVTDGSRLFEQPTFFPYDFGEPQNLIDHLWRLAGARYDDCAFPYLARELAANAKNLSQEEK